MTAPLFTDRDPCGCERALGHVCCPPWMDENEWPEQVTRTSELQACNRYAGGEHKSGPVSGGNTRRGLTHTSSGTSREVGYP